MLLAFQGISRPIAVTGGPLVQLLSAVLHGWEFEELPSGAVGAPIISLQEEGDGYRLDSHWLTSPDHYHNDVDAICSFIVELVRAYVIDDASLLCLHCAAAEFAGRLVLFPSHNRAGKSTLMAALAAAGVRVYADDVLPIKTLTCQAVATGIAPRLRLPMPEGASAQFHRFAETHQGPGNKRYHYLALSPEVLAQHGEVAPVGACVLLDRGPEGRAELLPASKGELLKRVILRNFAREAPGSEIISNLHTLVDESQCLTLRYASLEDAVAVLREAFGRWPEKPRAGKIKEAVVHPAAPVPPTKKNGSGQGPTRNPGVIERKVDDELFLVHPVTEAIYSLNPIGSALWRLFANPVCVDEAVHIMCEAFPEVGRATIEADVAKLVEDLTERDLLFNR